MVRRTSCAFVVCPLTLAGVLIAAAAQPPDEPAAPEQAAKEASPADEPQPIERSESSSGRSDLAASRESQVSSPGHEGEESGEPSDAPEASAATETPGVRGLLPERWVKQLRWRCIGPAGMGGRITDIAVCPNDASTYWVATASGGLLKTKNNGTTFEHQFDHEATVSIGAIAVAPSDPEIVWVGTGEANPRNSVSWGDGVYKSIDGGKTWKNMGLKESFQIGGIAVDPTDADTVYVGALGRLWGPNEERGLYKTTDGGATWNRVLYVDDKAGVVDVRIDPSDSNTLLAATYERQRDGLDSNDPAKKFGPGSGLYKTTDGGATWRRITAGLPGCQLGRIGISYYQKDPKMVYVVVESERIGKEPDDAAYAGIRGQDVEVGARITEIVAESPAEESELKVQDIVVAVDGATVHSFDDLSAEIRKHKAGDTAEFEVSRERKSVMVDVTFGRRPKREEDEQEDAPPSRRKRRERRPFSSGLGGQRENVHAQQGSDGFEYGGVYRSADGGETWTRINSVNPRPMYFSRIGVDPSDNNYLYVLGVSLYRSKDGGETFTTAGDRGLHPDHHALWIDPNDGRHILLGTDGGLYVSYDRGESWDHLNHVAIGQFYHVGVGPRRNYRVYGGLQDNGSWGGPSRSRANGGPVNDDWFRVGGGDGFVCRVDPNDADRIYYASQNGATARLNLRTGERSSLRPRRERGVRHRWNWKTPFILSHHNSQIYYSAGDRVFRSLDRGEGPRAISPGITRTDKGSATALAESKFDPDVLYVGSDDGAMWMTRNAGHDWEQVIDFPPDESDEEGGPGGTGPGAGAEEPQGPEHGPEPDPGKALSGDAPPSGPGSGLMSRIMRRDVNGDGLIQRDEAPERMSMMFDRVDTNGDGVLDKQELEQMARRFRQRRVPPPVHEGGGNDAPSRVVDRRTNGHGNGSPNAARAATRPIPSDKPAPERPAEPDATPAADRPPQAEEPEAAEETSEPLATPSESPKKAPKTPATAPVAEEVAEGAAVPAADDPVSGAWSGQAIIEGAPRGEGGFSFQLKLEEKGKVSGTMQSRMGEGPIYDGRYDADERRLRFTFETEMMSMELTATVEASVMFGTVDVGGGRFTFDFEARRAGAEADATEGGVPDTRYEWKPLTELLPGPRWVSSIETSRFEKDRVYVTLDGHRSDDDEPYLFVSEDAGATWRSIRANVPTSAGSTKVIREDIKNPDLLYLGTEFGAWLSIDRGASWTRLNNNLPTVAVHEFASHPTAGEIVAATHGRSLWVLDVTALRQFTKAAIEAPVTLYKPRTGIHWRREPARGGWNGSRRFTGENPPAEVQIYYSLGKTPGFITLEIRDLRGRRVRELEASYDRGLHRVAWDLRRTPRRRSAREGGRDRSDGRMRSRGRLAPAGTYVVMLTVDDDVYTQDLVLATDPDHPHYRPWDTEESASDDLPPVRDAP